MCQRFSAASITHASADATLAALLDEVTDAVLRQKVLYFADAAATADLHVASAEAWVMEAALKRWHLEEAAAQA